MSRRQEGIVLLTTITMIAVLSLLVLSLMQAVFLYMKVCNQIVNQHEDFYRLEYVAHQLMTIKPEGKCMMTAEDPNDIIEQLLQKGGCIFKENDHNFSYLMNDLGVIPCLTILSGKETFSSHHWLITVATEPPNKEILQIRVAKQVTAITCEHPEKGQINQGIISWRFIYP